MDEIPKELRDEADALQAKFDAGEEFSLVEQINWEIGNIQDGAEEVENPTVNFRMKNMAFTLNRDFAALAEAGTEDTASHSYRERHQHFSIDIITADKTGRWAPIALDVVKDREGRELDVLPSEGITTAPYDKYVPKDIDPDFDLTDANMCLQMQNTSLHDPSYHTITQDGGPGWFQGEVIDTGFDFIEKIMEAEKHRIALSNVYYATDLFKIGHWISAESVAHPDFADLYRLEGDHHIDKQMKAKFQDKEFIIFPINDGFPSGLVTQEDNRPWDGQLLKWELRGILHPDPAGSTGPRWWLIVATARSRATTSVRWTAFAVNIA
jgi:hypothetical protein